MAYDIHRNAYLDYAEQPGIFARLCQSFADYREYLATYELPPVSLDIALSERRSRWTSRGSPR